jgi:hypothetical protein
LKGRLQRRCIEEWQDLTIKDEDSYPQLFFVWHFTVFQLLNPRADQEAKRNMLKNMKGI